MKMRVAAVVLAAGSSSRLGKPKQLLEWEGQTLLRRTVNTVLASNVAAVVVTTAPNGVDFERELSGLDWTRAQVKNAPEGQSQSVQAGLNAVELLGDFDAILFTPCDLPLLSTSHLNALLSRFQSKNWSIVASRFDAVLGAPMIVGRALWPELQKLSGDVGARKLLAVHLADTTSILWEEGRFDLDTPHDVAEWMNSKDLLISNNSI